VYDKRSHRGSLVLLAKAVERERAATARSLDLPALDSAHEMIPKHVTEASEIFHTSLRSQKQTAKQITSWQHY